MEDLCRGSYTIMLILRSRNATNKIRGMTISEICGLERVSKTNTVHKRIKKMLAVGFVHEGVRAGKAKTYFLTDAGAEVLPPPKEKKEELEE